MIKPCISFPGYSATINGEILSTKNKMLKHTYNKKGYAQVSVNIGKKFRPISVHTLVADAFHGPRPIGFQVRHIDGKNQNNRPENLLYGTAAENAKDRRRHGKYFIGDKHPNSKLSNTQAETIREKRVKGAKVKFLAEFYKVSTATIESIIYKKSYCEFKKIEGTK